MSQRGDLVVPLMRLCDPRRMTGMGGSCFQRKPRPLMHRRAWDGTCVGCGAVIAVGDLYSATEKASPLCISCVEPWTGEPVDTIADLRAERDRYRELVEKLEARWLREAERCVRAAHREEADMEAKAALHEAARVFRVVAHDLAEARVCLSEGVMPNISGDEQRGEKLGEGKNDEN